MLNGAGEHLSFLIQYSTHPEVTSRLDSVADFLDYLEKERGNGARSRPSQGL